MTLYIDILHSTIWSGIAVMMFCRAVKLGPESRRVIVLSVSAVGTLSIGQAIAPYVLEWNFTVHLLDLMIAGALFAFFGGFGESWKNGPPKGSQRK